MDYQKTLVFLHGWGVNSKIFEPLFYYFKNPSLPAGRDFKIYALDLPGFGKTPIEKTMALKDYADFVYEFLKTNKIENPIIIGHSFGGAVSVKLSLIYPDYASKLVLVSASALRQPRRKMIFIKKMADILKPLLPKKIRKLILKILGYNKTDYAQIESSKLKETFKNVIGEDLGPYFHLIKIPTLIIWGEKDMITPLSEGKTIAENIPSAKLEVIKNSGHFVFLEKPEEFTKLIKEFAL